MKRALQVLAARVFVIEIMKHIISNQNRWRERWKELWRRHDLREVRIAVAYCSKHGAAEICNEWSWRKPKVQLLVGLNDGVTDISAREKLAHWRDAEAQVEVKGAFQNSGRFHPKVYVFVFDEVVHVLLGSVNLTRSAFYDNTEAAIELVLSPHDESAQQIHDVLDEWWEKEQILAAPGAVELQLARANIEERLLETMNHVAWVQIEALLAEARGHFETDVFELGAEIRIDEGAFLIERLRKTQILLLGQATYAKLVNLRDKAHENCRLLSFHTSTGRFVPQSAFAQWKIRHQAIEKEFVKTLQRFQNEDERREECRELERKLPDEILKVWHSIHKETSMPADNLKAVTEQFLKQFDVQSPRFAQTIHLNLSMARHPLPYMLRYAATPSVLETELHRHAVVQRETQLREWAKTLVCTTRKAIIEAFNGLRDERKQQKTHRKICETLAERLKQLNFYEDAFCREVEAAVHSLHNADRTTENFERLQAQAEADWSSAQHWMDTNQPFNEMLADFAQRVGWKS